MPFRAITLENQPRINQTHLEETFFEDENGKNDMTCRSVPYPVTVRTQIEWFRNNKVSLE